MADELSEYEKQRNENIARNQKVLQALGLVRSDAELHQELRRGRGEPKGKKRRVAPDGPEAHRAAVRRSQRLAGLNAEEPGDDEAGGMAGAAAAAPPAHDSARHGEARAEYDLWVQRWSGRQAGVTVVGTASYAHTLMRVMTMSEAGLANRIKAIERACGQHAVAKMKLFATILALEGYVELAEDASSAYDRLREKLGEPGAAAEEEEGE